jgi:ketosteroid isomerase-like protein
MSESNIHTLQTMFEAFKKGDLAGALASADPAIEAEPSSTFPGQEVYRGHEGVLRFFAMFLEAWDEYHAEPVEFIDAGDDVVVVVHQRARGKGSGVMIESDMFQVWTFRGGKAVRMRVCSSREEALELARGLPPS